MTDDVKRTTRRRNDPEQTRLRILDAARKEFAEKGFDGARVDEIASRAKVNKQLIYYYYDNKDELFTRVLEDAYQDIRQKEAIVKTDHLPADEALLRLVEFTWKYYLDNPEFIRLLNSENQLKARHLKKSADIVDINSSWVSTTAQLLARGRQEGNVRSDIDVMQFNINVAALGFFYLINQSTLSILYQRDLIGPKSLEERLAVMKDTIACWIRPAARSEDRCVAPVKS